MACKSIIPKGWSDANTVENQCHLMDAICTETVALQTFGFVRGRGLVAIRSGDCETSARAGSALGPLVFRPSCYGFTIPKRRDKTF